MTKFISILFVVACVFTVVKCLNNGLAITPAMGWNSWNHFNCDIHEDLIK